MLPFASLTAAGLLGTTPRASSPDDDQGAVSTTVASTSDRSRATTSTAVPISWYHTSCVPFATSIVSYLRSVKTLTPEYRLVKGLAEMVETFSAGTETDECANGVRHMMETGISASGHTHVSNHKAQVLTKWMLLEQLSGILQCQPWTITPPARVDSREKIHSRMEGVLKAVETWPEIFESLKSHVRLMHNAKQSDFLLPASSTLTVIQDAHLRGLKILHGARRSVRLSKYATMERNVQYMAFMVHWHSTHNTPFPQDAGGFFQHLSEDSNRTGFQDQAGHAFGEMVKKDKEELFSSLKSCLDLSVHVSPLVLLGTVPGSSFHMLRSKLIQWGLDLGPKPDYILAAEKAIWSVVMGIALGQDSSELLKWLVQSSAYEFENLEVNADNINKFFINGYMGTPVNQDPDDDVQMSVQESAAHMPGAQDDVPMSDAKAMDPDSPPPTRPSSPLPSNSLPTSPGRPADDEVLSPPVPTPTRLRSVSPLSSLSSISDSEDEEAAATPAAQPAPTEVRSSGRTVKTPARFTSGVALTQPTAPAPKKRKLESEGLTPGPVTVAMKEEELYWATAFAHVTAAAFDIAPNPLPSGRKGKKRATVQPPPTEACAPRYLPEQPLTITQRSTQSVSVPYFDESNDLGAQEYLFQPDALSAEMDIRLLTKIVDNVRSKFDSNGQPPHRQTAASDPDLGPNHASSIFVVNCQKFNAMTSAQKQAIFRHRHILVTGVDSGHRIDFDEAGLETLEELDTPVSLQYSDKKSAWNYDAMLRTGRLRDLLNHAQSESPVAINALDLPLGGVSVPVPPSYLHIATDAFSGTRVRHLVDVINMQNVTSWGTAATANTVSWFHIDDDGFGTAVSVQAGKKWWVLARKKNPNPRADEMGDVSTFHGWNVEDIDGNIWELEAVLLDRHVVLYMRGCTPHFVIGLAHSIVFGRHFYAMGGIRRSCYGMVHTFVMGYGITNTFHDDGTRSMIRQLLALWYRQFVLRGVFDAQDEHVPDMRTQDGLLDVIAVGCVLEFTTALSRTRYHPSYDSGTDEARALRVQENQAREWFRVIMKEFGAKHQIVSKNAIVHVSTIWQSVIVLFAIGVVNHMKEKRNFVPTAAGVTPEAVENALRMHLREDHPHLIPAFDAGLKMPRMTELSWPTGQFPLEVVPNCPSYRHLLHALGVPEQHEIPGLRLSLSPAQGCTGARNTVHRFYGGVWPGEDLPNDEF